MDIINILAVIGVGIVMGFINTVAGSGSLLSLPVLMFLGLSPATANGTNRVAILLQSIVGVSGFRKYSYMKPQDWRLGFRLTIPAILGSLVGAALAVLLDADLMKKIFAGLLIIMFFLILLKPEKWLKGKDFIHPKPTVSQYIIFFFIGIYLGFIQAGVGFFLLAGLVLSVGYDLMKSNAQKVMIVLFCTPFALGVFIYNGNVNYLWGLILGIGTMIGAFLATKYAAKLGSNFVRWIVLITLAIDSLKLLNVF